MTGKKSFYLIGLFVTILWTTGCGDKIEPGNVAPIETAPVKAHVTVAKVSQQPFVYEAVGTTKARTASTISSKLMGTVRSIRVNEGDQVKAGDVLVVLDQRQVAAHLKGTEAALAEAKHAEASARSAREASQAGAVLSRATYERYLQLMKDDSVSQQEFDEVEARHRQTEASLTQTEAMLEAAGYRVQQAEAAVAAAGVGEKDAVVRAPYDGKVTAKMIDVGDLTSPGTPLVTLEKKGVYCADLVLPEEHIDSVDLDQEVQVAIPALADALFLGRIGRIVPAVDQKSRSFLVKVALPENPKIRSGLFARVKIPIGEAGILLIPTSAVVRQGQLTGFYLVDAEERARFRLLRLGRVFGDSAEVISGMKEGDRYVASPTPKLVDGAWVEVDS
jgi:RND family efflux transporter MFP subunit